MRNKDTPLRRLRFVQIGRSALTLPEQERVLLGARLRFWARIFAMRHWKKAARHRDRKRALWAGAVIFMICAGSLYMASHVVRSSDQIRSANRAGQIDGAGRQASSSGTGENGDEYLTTGTILYVPLQGNVCRKRLIDNKTWLIRDKGYVVCDEAVSWNANTAPTTTYSPHARVDAIRSGFVKK